MFLVPTCMPTARDTITNASQPKTAVFQWLALQRPIRAAMLFDFFRGDISSSPSRSGVDRFAGIACAGEEVDAEARRVCVGVVEGVHGLRGPDLELEVVTALGVEDPH